MQNLKYALNLIEKLHKISIILMCHRHVYSNTYCMEIYPAFGRLLDSATKPVTNLTSYNFMCIDRVPCHVEIL